MIYACHHGIPDGLYCAACYAERGGVDSANDPGALHEDLAYIDAQRITDVSALRDQVDEIEQRMARWYRPQGL